MPTDIDQIEAHEALQRSLQYRKQKALGFVHYECGRIGESRCVHAIAIKIPGTGITQLFSSEKSEARALKGFAAYMAKYSSDENLWCAWEMRNENYGFPHLASRLGELAAGKIVVPTPDVILNLGMICWQLNGNISTGGKQRLPYLCELNGIRTQGIMDCDAIQDAVKNKQWSAVEASVLRKVEMIYAIWDRMAGGKFVTTAKTSKKRRRRGRPPASREVQEQRSKINDAWQSGKWKDKCELANYFGISYADADRMINTESRAAARKSAEAPQEQPRTKSDKIGS